MMSKIITAAMLALAMALVAGCGSVEVRSPLVMKPSQPVVQKATPVMTVAPASAQGKLASSVASETSSMDTNQFNPGILSAEQKAKNLKKCEGWGKLSAAEKKKKNFFCWQRVGGDPYQGKVETALVQSNWPAEVQNLFLNQIRQDNKAEMVLERGMTFDWSTFGKGVSKAFVHRNVVADWKEGEVHRASVFTVSHRGKIYKLYLPRDCANWSGNVYSVPAPVAVPVAPVVTGACPNGWTLKADAFARKTLPPELLVKVDQAIAAAKSRESQGGAVLEPYLTDAVSRTLGRELHEKVAFADVNADIVIRYIDQNPNGQLVIQNIGVLSMRHGTGIFRFTDDPTKHLAVGTGWPEFFLSPTASGSATVEGGLEPKLRIHRNELKQCNLRMSGITP